MAEAGVGLAYAFEPMVAAQLQRGSLRLVLEAFAAPVPGFFLYFPSRAQVSPAFRAFLDTVQGLTAKWRVNAKRN
jgi:DNA-binding transcriptional LysR family regulator